MKKVKEERLRYYLPQETVARVVGRTSVWLSKVECGHLTVSGRVETALMQAILGLAEIRKDAAKREELLREELALPKGC